ncbi:MAG: MBL fold metallo-hydrolase [Mycolicibacterium sp.]|nr:MBL fold metallo-hydrolase [Mycolicibacterium sp.]
MRIRRLGWAGIEVINDRGSSLVVDFVRDFSLLRATQPDGAFAEPERAAALALVTHLHEDHTDVAAIQSAVGDTGLVLRPAPFVAAADEAVFTDGPETDLAASTLNARTVDEWDRIHLPPFTITAVPAVDGLGDPQLNWVIEADGQRVFHGGDTIFHGYWWLIAKRAGPIDLAVMPINGAVVNVPHLQPSSPLPAVMTPEQAAQAALILGSRAVLPMHFGVHQPPVYVEAAGAVERLVDASGQLALRVLNLEPGQGIDVAHAVGVPPPVTPAEVRRHGP